MAPKPITPAVANWRIWADRAVERFEKTGDRADLQRCIDFLAAVEPSHPDMKGVSTEQRDALRRTLSKPLATASRGA